MNIKKIAITLALCAASVACAAPSDEIFTRSGTNEAERPFAENDSLPEELKQADEPSQAEFELPVIESKIPLIRAARDGDAEKVRELLADGAEVDAHEKNGITALMAAAFCSHEQIADELLDRGADVNASTADGRTPLMFALRGGMSKDFIEKLLAGGAYPETRAKDGMTPMMIACAYTPDPQIIQLLYSKGAEIALPCKTGDTPLHFVARNPSDGAPEIAKFLIKNRAPIWEKNAAGATPLMTGAEISSRADVIEVLLEADWRVNAKRNDGMTALMLAAGNPTPAALEIAKYLIAAGASFETTDNLGRTAYLIGLSTAHSLEMVRRLKDTERGAAERETDARLSVQPTVKFVENAGQIVLPPKPKSEGTGTAEAEDFETLSGIKVEKAQKQPAGNDSDASRKQDKTELEKGPQVTALNFPSKAQNAPEKLSEKNDRQSEIAPLANVSLASNHIATTSLRKTQVKKSETMRPFKKRRALKKLRVARKKDPVLIPQLLLAAVNPTEAAPEIIAWLIERGESLEARDTEGRTALICAVRYNPNPLAARALLEAGANPRVAYKKSSLIQLLRYNGRMENDDKEALAKLIRAAKKK